jgi:hypothetical protein
MNDKPKQQYLNIVKNMLDECNDTIEENSILGKDETVMEFYHGYKSALVKVIRAFDEVK